MYFGAFQFRGPKYGKRMELPTSSRCIRVFSSAAEETAPEIKNLCGICCIVLLDTSGERQKLLPALYAHSQGCHFLIQNFS